MTYPGGAPLDASKIERWIIVIVNEEREASGLRPLVHDPKISDIARAHSVNMMQQDSLSHSLDGRNSMGRARTAGYSCRASYGENLVKQPRIKTWGETSRGGVVVSWRAKVFDADEEAAARRIVAAWMESSKGHGETILGPGWQRTGWVWWLMSGRSGTGPGRWSSQPRISRLAGEGYLVFESNMGRAWPLRTTTLIANNRCPPASMVPWT